MTSSIKSEKFENEEAQVVSQSNDDDQELLALGYKPSFKREFTSLATVRSATFYDEICTEKIKLSRI